MQILWFCAAEVEYVESSRIYCESVLEPECRSSKILGNEHNGAALVVQKDWACKGICRNHSTMEVILKEINHDRKTVEILTDNP